MKVFVDATYLAQREQYRFAATCQHCEHFDPTAKTCSFTFPVTVHLDETHQALAEGDVVMFCKTFEMG